MENSTITYGPFRVLTGRGTEKVFHINTSAELSDFYITFNNAKRKIKDTKLCTKIRNAISSKSEKAKTDAFQAVAKRIPLLFKKSK